MKKKFSPDRFIIPFRGKFKQIIELSLVKSQPLPYNEHYFKKGYLKNSFLGNKICGVIMDAFPTNATYTKKKQFAEMFDYTNSPIKTVFIPHDLLPDLIGHNGVAYIVESGSWGVACIAANGITNHVDIITKVLGPIDEDRLQNAKSISDLVL